MAAVAAFSGSDSGKMYARVCERWAVDPAASFSDSVVAYNLRAALALAVIPDVPELSDLERTAAENERIWLGQG